MLGTSVHREFEMMMYCKRQRDLSSGSWAWREWNSCYRRHKMELRELRGLV